MTESTTQKKNKKKKQGRSDVIVSCFDNVFPNTYPSKQSQKKSGVGYFFFLGIISSGV